MNETDDIRLDWSGGKWISWSTQCLHYIPHNGEPREGWAQQFSPYFKCQHHRKSLLDNSSVVVIRCVPPPPHSLMRCLRYANKVGTWLQKTAGISAGVNDDAVCTEQCSQYAASIARIIKSAESQVSVPNECSPCAATLLPPGALRTQH